MSQTCDAPFTRVKTCTSETTKVDDVMEREGWLEQACLQGNMYLVKRILEQENAHNKYACLAHACLGGHHEGQNRDIVNFIIEQGADDWNEGLRYACEEGHLDLAMLMIERGADNWTDGLHNACEGGHLDLVNLMIDHAGQQRDATLWNKGLRGACNGGHLDITMMMIERGANNWDIGFRRAYFRGHFDIMMLMTQRIILAGGMHVPDE